MENKWKFVSSLIFAGYNVGIWIKAIRDPKDPTKFLFETKAEEMSREEILKAQKENVINYFAKDE